MRWTAVALAVAGFAAEPAGAALFQYTGGEQEYDVPSGVTMVHVVAIGGAGADGATSTRGAAAGGVGAEVHADVPVTPGTPLFVEVGGSPGHPGAGGFNGGGDSDANGGGGGGGGSDLRTCSRSASSCPFGTDTLTSRVLVAGAGAGGGSPSAGASYAGGAGGAAGASGSWSTSPPYESQQGGPGDPGTTSSGGGVTQENNLATTGSPGVFGAGGRISPVAGQSGGGGGGGWFGGAAGGTSTDGIGGGGGGGGSSYAATGASNVSIALATTRSASIAITPLRPALTPSAQAVAFPATTIGAASAPQVLTLANTGQAPLEVTGIAVQGVGDFAIAASTCAAPLAPGAACQLTLRFAPQAAGARAAGVVVSVDGLADQTVALSGTGTAPSVAPAGPPTGTRTCGRRCRVSFPADVLALTARSHATAFTLTRKGAHARGTVTVAGGAVVLHARGRVAAGTYLLMIRRGRRIVRELVVTIR